MMRATCSLFEAALHLSVAYLRKILVPHSHFKKRCGRVQADDFIDVRPKVVTARVGNSHDNPRRVLCTYSFGGGLHTCARRKTVVNKGQGAMLNRNARTALTIQLLAP